MEKENLLLLLEKIESGSATKEELSQYNQLYMHFQNTHAWDPVSMGERGEIEEKLFTRISETINVSKPTSRSYSFVKYVAAAIVVITFSAGFYLYHQNNSTWPKEASQKFAKINDIAPGGNKAMLTLANGTKISLTDAANGNLIKQSGISVTKTADGQLVYKISDPQANATTEVQFNTITTPNGGQYQVLLPDGSKVWLNAASSLRFPTVFVGKERNVELTGEAYFEVATNKKLPLNVFANGTKVTVLGTHFNVMAYQNEKAVKTTLLEGSVKLTNANAVSYLKPGQQGTIGDNSVNFVVQQADMASVMAWKNGNFLFDNASLPELMRQISRWYDVDVIYPEKLNDYQFVGEVSRKYSLIKILKILELSGVTFKIEGRTLTVTNK